MLRKCRLNLRLFIAIVAWLILVGFSILILLNSLPYARMGMHHPFLQERLDLAANWAWRGCLYLHITAGVACLFSTFLQFCRPVLRRLPSLHRYLGFLYSYALLYIVGPTGLFLALMAKGGMWAKSGFMVTALLAMVFTRWGLEAMRQKILRDHIIWMIRSFALITSAITFRVIYVGFFWFSVSDAISYPASVWLSATINLLGAECVLLIFRRRFPARQTTLKPNLNLSLSSS